MKMQNVLPNTGKALQEDINERPLVIFKMNKNNSALQNNNL